MLNRSDYMLWRETVGYVIIKDSNKGDMSVTHDADNIVAELSVFLKGRKLYYYDTDNNLDEIVIRNGKFAGFKTGGPAEHALKTHQIRYR